MTFATDDGTMRCVRFLRAGGPEVIELAEVPDPKPGPLDVVVRVRAAGLNRANLIQRMGRYPAPPGVAADVPGLEFAGEIEALGERVRELNPERAIGERVMGLAGGGAQAQRVVVHSRMLVRIPPAVSFEEAASIPEAFITAHDALFTQGRLTAGETLVIHAVGSGVGTAALQLARAAGALTIGTSRSRDKLPRATGLGLSHAIEVGPERRFAGQIMSLTQARGAEMVLDFVGSSYLAENLAALATRGRLALVGTLGGTEGTLDIGVVMRKRLSLFGTVLRTRPLEEAILATQLFAAQVLPQFTRGLVRPVIDKVFSMEEVRAAHERLQKDEGFGKIVLRMD